MKNNNNKSITISHQHFDDVDLDNGDTSSAEITATSSLDESKTNHNTKSKMYKNVFLLGGMWAVGWGAALVQIPSAQNVMTSLNRDAISTVPLGLIMLLSAPCAVFVPKLIERIGEQQVFVLAAIAGILGSVLQAIGIWAFGGNTALEIALLCIGAAIQAFPFASTNNLRFAVAYFSSEEFLPKATALVVLGGAAGALLGPMLSSATRDLIPGAKYAGNFFQAACLWLIFGVLAMLVDFAPPASSSAHNKGKEDNEDHKISAAEEGTPSQQQQAAAQPERSLREIVTNTSLVLLILSQCLSYNIMALYMTNIQLAMEEVGYTQTQTANAVTYHMLGMYLPSLVSGHLIALLGTWLSSFVGFSLLLLGGGLFYVNDSLLMFNLGIIIVGVGWNISFVGPSAAVSSSIIEKESEKSKVQGLNDGIMLFSIGVFGLAASAIYIAIGSWDMFNAVMMGFSFLAMLMTLGKAVYDRVQDNK